MPNPNPKPPRDVYVDVYIDVVIPLAFRVIPSPKNNPQLPIGPKGEIIFNNNHHNGFNIHFELQGDTHGYFFPPNAKKHDAVWSQLGNVCPKTSQVAEVFHPLSVTEPPPPPPPPPPPKPPECRELIVLNPNPTPAQGAFQYNLRVTNDGGVNYLNLDPGGDNQNGPISRYNWSTALVFLGGAVAGSLATLAGQALIQG